MVDAKFVRRVLARRTAPDATRRLADPTRIGCAIVRRPASIQRTITTTLGFASTI
jgi:hypothetical protein